MLPPHRARTRSLDQAHRRDVDKCMHVNHRRVAVADREPNWNHHTDSCSRRHIDPSAESYPAAVTVDAAQRATHCLHRQES